MTDARSNTAPCVGSFAASPPGRPYDFGKLADYAVHVHKGKNMKASWSSPGPGRPEVGEHFWGEGSPQALLAGYNDLGILGHLAAHVLHKGLVGDHVAAAQPPAAQPKVGQLLQDVQGAPLRLRDVDGHLNGSIHCRLHGA